MGGQTFRSFTDVNGEFRFFLACLQASSVKNSPEGMFRACASVSGEGDEGTLKRCQALHALEVKCIGKGKARAP